MTMKGQSQEWHSEEAKQRSLSNLNPQAAYIHGLRSANFESTLSEFEKEMILQIEQDILTQLGDTATPNDKVQASRYAITLIKVNRQDAQENQSIKHKDYSKELRDIEQQLGLDRRYRLSRGNVENGTDPIWLMKQLFDFAEGDE